MGLMTTGTIYRTARIRTARSRAMTARELAFGRNRGRGYAPGTGIGAELSRMAAFAVALWILGSGENEAAGCAELTPRQPDASPASIVETTGSPVLVTFVHASATRPDGRLDPSRSQVVVLRSMAKQHTQLGLRAAVVIAGQLDPERVVNVGFDWDLEGIHVLHDRCAKTVSAYAVSRFPTSLLIDGSGSILARWDGFASAFELSLVIDRSLGHEASGAAGQRSADRR